MPKPPVLAVVHNIEGDIFDAIASIEHRLLHNPNGYTAEQILAEMGPKAEAFVKHFTTGHAYLGTPPPELPTVAASNVVTKDPAGEAASDIPAPAATTTVAATPPAPSAPQPPVQAATTNVTPAK